MLVQAEIVGDDELPAGIDRVVVERKDHVPLYLIRESAAPKAFAWECERLRLGDLVLRQQP